MVRPFESDLQENGRRANSGTSETLNFLSLIGGLASGDMMQGVAALRLQTAMSEIPFRDRSGTGVEQRLDNGNRLRTYNTGALMEHDNLGRLVRMTLPGSNAPSITLQYEGRNSQPSRATVGSQTVCATDGQLVVDPTRGEVRIITPNLRADYNVNGNMVSPLPGGATYTRNYDPANRETVEMTRDGGRMVSQVVTRWDGSGYRAKDGQIAQRTYAPGTNLTFRTPGTTDDVVFENVETLNFSVDNVTGLTNAILFTRDGRRFDLDNIWADTQTGRAFAGQWRPVEDK